MQQVRLRARRLGALDPGLWLVAETDLPALLDHVEQLQPSCLVVDSIQTVADPEVGSAPGSVAQVRECAHRLVQAAKRGGVATILVGHVTKEGALAGPRVLEHLVDTVLSFEGDRHHALRLLRAVKHRFGPTGELGLFEMVEQGFAGCPTPAPCSSPTGGPEWPARPSSPPPKATVLSWSNCRPSSCRRRSRTHGSAPRGSTAAGWPCCWPSFSAGPA